MRAWVEQGTAPKQMVATKYENDRPENRVVMTRPLCPYPQIAGYVGAGPTTEASSFRCETTGRLRRGRGTRAAAHACPGAEQLMVSGQFVEDGTRVREDGGVRWLDLDLEGTDAVAVG